MQNRISASELFLALGIDKNIIDDLLAKGIPKDLDRELLLYFFLKSNISSNVLKQILLNMRNSTTAPGKLCARKFGDNTDDLYDAFFKEERSFKAKINDALRDTYPKPTKMLLEYLGKINEYSYLFPLISDLSTGIAEHILALIRQGADPNVAFKIDSSNNYRIKDVFRGTMGTEYQFTLAQLEELLMYGLDLSIAKKPLFATNTPGLYDYVTLIMHYGCHPTIDLPRDMTLLDCALRDANFTKPAHIRLIFDLLNYGATLTHTTIFFTPYAYPTTFPALLQWLTIISPDQLNTRILDYLKKFKDQLLKAMAELPPKEELAMLEKIFGRAPHNALRKVFFAGHTNILDSNTRLGRAFILYNQLKSKVAGLSEAALKHILDTYPLDVPAAMQLIRAGVTPDVQGKNDFALLHLLAIEYDNANVIELVQQHSATINIKNQNGYTPYDLLITRDSSSAFNLAMTFVGLGVHPDTRTKLWANDKVDCILHRLVYLYFSGDITEKPFEEYLAKLVTEFKADINIVDADKSTPLQRCLKHPYDTKKIMFATQALIKLGADPLTKDDRGEDLLVRVIRANANDEYNDVVKLVFDSCSKVTNINTYANKLLQSSSHLSCIKLALGLNKFGIAPAFIDKQLIRTALADAIKVPHYYQDVNAYLLQARDMTTPLGRILFPEADTIAKRTENRAIMRELTQLIPWHNHKSLRLLFQPFYSSYNQFEAFPWDEALTLIEEGADPNGNGNLTTMTINDLTLSTQVKLNDVLYHSLLKNSVPTIDTVKALLEFGLDFSTEMTHVSEILKLFLEQGRYEHAVLFIQYGADYRISTTTNFAMFQKETKITALDAVLKKINTDYSTPLSEQAVSAILDLLACEVPITLADDKVFAALLKWLDQVPADKLTDAVVNHLKPFKDQLLTAMEKEPTLELMRLTQIFNPQYADSALRKVFFAGHPSVLVGRLGKAYTRYEQLIDAEQAEHALDEFETQDTAFGFHNGL